MRWIRAIEKLPGEGVECLVCCRTNDSKAFPQYTTHPMSAEWNGKEWVDIEGDVVDNVVFWQEIPIVSQFVGVAEKIKACLENDACEMTECCYFTKQKELSALLKYIKELEEKQ